MNSFINFIFDSTADKTYLLELINATKNEIININKKVVGSNFELA
jgi:hypothetical protein